MQSAVDADTLPGQVGIAGRRGADILASGDYRRAIETLEAAAAISSSDALATARVLNDLGRAYVAIDRPLRAIAAFDDALRLTPSDHPALFAAAGMNLSKALLSIGDVLAAGRIMASVDEPIEAVVDPDMRARLNLMLGTLYRDALNRHGAPPGWRRLAQDKFEIARSLADNADNDLLHSDALGYLGRIYEDGRRWTAALQTTRQAGLLAQQLGAADRLYQWQWQSARILRARGEPDRALSAYALAIDTLAEARLEVAGRSHSSFRFGVAPLYFEYADLLLASNAGVASGAVRQENLRLARHALEQLKVAEVEEYFDDECAVNENQAELEQMSANAAILYPIVLPDRIELLLSLPDGLSQTTVRVSEDVLGRVADRLRLSLESPANAAAYRPFAEALYDWLVRPIEAPLDRSGVDTLVVVPGGALRTIPMAVLHDGERFLIERIAIAVSPGLRLTRSTESRSGADAYVQINGLTETVQGYPALPHVADELASIAAVYSGSVNRDADFSASGLESDLADRPYDFVHIATHGQFHSDPRRSFLLTHDEVITMDRLEGILNLRRYVSEPVDLLFLSACQTAAGDDRAALGLAGAAVKSGASSVVASLWLINDQSTARLVSAFYRTLRSGTGNKADALRAAQLSLLRDEQYAHPNYWAPFLLIGNWL